MKNSWLDFQGIHLYSFSLEAWPKDVAGEEHRKDTPLKLWHRAHGAWNFGENTTPQTLEGLVATRFFIVWFSEPKNSVSRYISENHHPKRNHHHVCLKLVVKADFQVKEFWVGFRPSALGFSFWGGCPNSPCPRGGDPGKAANAGLRSLELQKLDFFQMKLGVSS